jgi:hypothetical protein
MWSAVMNRTIAMLFLAAAFAPAIAFGQEPATRAEIASAFVGQTATFAGYGGGIISRAKFGEDGSYTYTYHSDYDTEIYTGRYAVHNGEICVTYTGGATGSACYAVLKEKDGRFLWKSPGWGLVTFEP